MHDPVPHWKVSAVFVFVAFWGVGRLAQQFVFKKAITLQRSARVELTLLPALNETLMGI
jgi:hypothetical protein